jgi:hypothetical protein
MMVLYLKTAPTSKIEIEISTHGTLIYLILGGLHRQ